MDKDFSIAKAQFSLYGDQLSQLIETLPFSAHLRDVKTDRFLMANQYQANNQGFDLAKAIIGVTSKELFHNHRSLYLQIGASLNQGEAYRQLFKAMAYQVEKQKSFVTFKECTILMDGRIYLGIQKKFPIMGNNQQVIAIFTTAEEITHKIDLFHLYHLYKTQYSSEELALRYFLSYLKIADYFLESLTNTEAIILLILRQAGTYKLASKILHHQYGIHMKSGTIGVHVQNLRKKLKKENDYWTLLTHIRNFRDHSQLNTDVITNINSRLNPYP